VQVPLKHWTTRSGCEMTESLFNVVQARTKKVVSATLYFSITCDEVTILDNQYWISIHIYTIQDWEKNANIFVLTTCD
jgi:hypothetical protein